MAHFCKNCGLLTAPYDERCPKCGAPLPHIPMGEALLESMRQSPEGTVETGEPLYEQDLEEDRIDAMSQSATTAAMLLFGNSALLHVVPWRSAKVTRVLCGIDYSNIFLIIAGTNTPVLFALSPAIRRPYLTVIWVTAAIGTILHIVWLRTPNWVFTTVYVVLGLAPVTLIPQLWTAPAVGPAATILIACGGAAYIAGAVCFALRKPNPVLGWFEFHEVFHLGTVIGYACHVVAIYLIVCAL